MKAIQLNKSGRPLLNQTALVTGVILYLVALLHLVMTILIPCGPKTNPVEVYTRNYSTIVLFFLLGIFLNQWAVIHSSTSPSKKTMKHYKLFSLFMILMCLGKFVISLFFTLKYMPKCNLVFFYYVGEVAAWAAITVFFCLYLKRMVINEKMKEISSRSRHQYLSVKKD